MGEKKILFLWQKDPFLQQWDELPILKNVSSKLLNPPLTESNPLRGC